MRSKKALINAIYGMLGYLVFMLSNLITRSALVNVVGIELAGMDTTFKNFLSFLSLAELGIGTGLIYKLYNPIVTDNKKEIKKILNFYKQAYKIIALVFMFGGIVIACFTWAAIKEVNPVYSGFLFVLYAGDTVASYLYANRKALIIADQRNYLVSRNDAFVSVISFIAQVSLLYLIKGNPYLSFVVYASVKILCRLLGAVLIGRKFKKLYPDIYNDKSKDMIDGEERKSLLKNMSAMLMHRIGAVSVTASGSAIISAFKGLANAGIYGNYTMIITTINMMVTQIFNGITASFGQFSSTDDKQAVYNKFNVLYFANFLIMAFCCTAFAVIIQPFMTVWIGGDNLFLFDTVIILTAYLYVGGIRKVIIMVKDSAGLFRPDRYLALTEALINIILSFVLINIFGINGLIMANMLSMLIIPLWSQPYLVFKYVIKDLKKLPFYYIRYIIYAGITALEVFLTYKLASFISFESIILEIVVKALLCIVVPNVINLLLFIKTPEMKELFLVAKSIFSFKNKLSNNN